jgi:hypothetical protein
MVEGIDEDVRHIIKVRWLKWRWASVILYDKKILNKLKEKFYRAIIRPTMMHGAEYWATKEQHIQKMSVAKMWMLRWICGHTRRLNQNDDVRGKFGVALIQEKPIQHLLWWFDHIQWRSSKTSIHINILSYSENTKKKAGVDEY